MSHGRIRKAFDDIVRGYGATKGWLVVTENSEATPTLNTPYLVTDLLPAATAVGTLGGDHKAYIGNYQIAIVVPAGEGGGRITTIVDELQALFPVFERIGYNPANPSQVVVVMSPVNQLDSTVDNGAFYTPTSFQYRSDTN